MCAQRTVWGQYKPFYKNRLASDQPYNPVEVMGYLPFDSPVYVIQGIAAQVKDGAVIGIGIWSSEILSDGKIGTRNGPFVFGKGELKARVLLPSNMVAVAWGMSVSGNDVSNLVVWARSWNSELKKLQGKPIAYTLATTDEVQISTPIPTEEQQMLVGVGAGVKGSTVNRIAAGYATLQQSQASSEPPVIWGMVDENGVVKRGKNFSSKKTGTGVYELTWGNKDSKTIPVIGLTSGLRGDEKDGSDNVFSFDEVTATGCKVYSVDVGGSKNKAQDEAFSFVAFFVELEGLLFGTVDQNGDKIVGTGAWSAKRKSKGKYSLEFSPPMKLTPNLIMTSGMRTTESTGSDDVISNDPPTKSGTNVFSLDVGNGSANSDDEVFSFFAWDLNVLPETPGAGFNGVATHRYVPGEGFTTSSKVAMIAEEESSAFYVMERVGKGHFRISFNIPLPELPIIFASAAVEKSDGRDGAQRVISYANVTSSSYDIFSTLIANGGYQAADGAFEVTVALADQFPL